MAAFLNVLLLPVSFLFKLASWFDWHIKFFTRQRVSSCMIISIDNLSFGGSGKTTLIKYLGEQLLQNNLPFAIVSRGYKSAVKRGHHAVQLDDEACRVGDEPLMLKNYFPNQPVYIGPDRVASIKSAQSHGVPIVLLDDGFQSAHIVKDLRILLFDPHKPGYLHRHFRFMRRHTDIQINFCPTSDCFKPHPPAPPQYCFKHLGLKDLHHCPVHLKGEAIVAFSALADNQRFFKDLASYNLKACHPFPDHHFFTDSDFQLLEDSMQLHQAIFCVCTGKDFIKLSAKIKQRITFLYAENSIEFNFDLVSNILTHERIQARAALSF